MNLDELLKRMNDELGLRQESDVGMEDKYWRYRAEYHQALANANNIHVISKDNPEITKLKRSIQEQLDSLIQDKK